MLSVYRPTSLPSRVVRMVIFSDRWPHRVSTIVLALASFEGGILRHGTGERSKCEGLLRMQLLP